MERRSRRPNRPRRKQAVGGASRWQSGKPNTATLGAMAVFGVAVVALAAVLVGKALSGGSGVEAGTVVVPGIAAGETATRAPSATATAAPATPTVPPTATVPATTYDSIPAQCGDLLAPLDKQHVLGADCVPADLAQLPGSIAIGGQSLTRTTIAALQDMFAAAAKDGYPALAVNSSYRSYATQADTYNYWVGLNGQAYADRTSARPGHSEHQLGTTADVCARSLCLEDFTGTAEAAWLSANSWKYGFIISYPEGKEAVTGYAPEAWHIRYLGKDVAARVHDSGLTLHEFLLRR